MPVRHIGQPPASIANKPKKRSVAKDAAGLNVLSLAMAPNAILAVTGDKAGSA
ncbi:hypothetical protein ACFL1X_13845 [Candidatus Hydrogenedentota bacterium]